MLEEVGGFDETNGPAADYDLYLRIARQFPILCHHQPVVHYRRHGDNMSNNAGVMLASTLAVLKKQRRHIEGSLELKAAYDIGRQHWKNYYGELLIVRMSGGFAQGRVLDAVVDAYTLARLYPERFVTFLKRKIAYLTSSL